MKKTWTTISSQMMATMACSCHSEFQTHTEQGMVPQELSNETSCKALILSLQLKFTVTTSAE